MVTWDLKGVEGDDHGRTGVDSGGMTRQVARQEGLPSSKMQQRRLKEWDCLRFRSTKNVYHRVTYRVIDSQGPKEIYNCMIIVVCNIVLQYIDV